MKRLSLVLVLICCGLLYAESEVTEKHLDAFMNNGRYIKVVVWHKDSKDVSYYNKQSIIEIYQNFYGTVCVTNDKNENIKYFNAKDLEDVKIDTDSNLILTYRSDH